DGDPLDVLVIMDQPAYIGCLIECRMLGVVTAIQREKNGDKARNDRFVAIAASSILYKDIKNVKELNKNLVEEIENFFIDYNKHKGKKFQPNEWLNKGKAMKIIKKAVID
ncbi:MAG TPA: inorganic diphosphatase, partial [Flavipsychrobacter sp.]|nr:inorganic diphosphatase [Flavipsychrobacter sp.]